MRALRKEKSLTLTELGEKTGFTPSFLSQLERGLKQPSLDAMRRIANCLGVSILTLLADRMEDRDGSVSKNVHCSIVRSGRRQRFSVENETTVFELITPQTGNDSRRYTMYGVLVSIEPGTWTNQKPVVHFYEECCYILSGKMRAFVGEEIYDLEAGDSIYIDGSAPHNYLNPGDEPLVMLAFQPK